MASRRGPAFSARVAFEGKYMAANWANVMWVTTQSSVDITQSDVTQLANDMYLAYTTNFPAPLVAAWSLERCRVTYFPAGEDTVIFGEHIAHTPGGNATGPATPANVALVISWFANVYWRGGKPRTYLCGISADNLLNNQQISTTFQSSMHSRATNFRVQVNALASGGFDSVTLGLVSFRSNKADRPAPLFFPILSESVGQRLDSQRRRLGREVL